MRNNFKYFLLTQDVKFVLIIFAYIKQKYRIQSIILKPKLGDKKWWNLQEKQASQTTEKESHESF